MPAPDRSPGKTEWPKREILIYVGILGMVWASVYLFDLGNRELIHEEGRRALCAREMTERNEYLVPTVLYQTYLNKPPGYPWLILLASWFTGEINEWALRFLSALGIVITANLIFFFASNDISLRSRFMASAIFLLTLMSLEKGRLGEIESCFTALVWASLWSIEWSLRSKQAWRWAIFSGMALGGAMLVKGPPALLFFYGTLLFYCIETRRIRWFLSGSHALSIGIAALMFAAWLIPAVERVGWQALAETGTREMVLRGNSGVAEFIDEQSSLISNTFVGLLPGSFFLLAYFWRNRWRRAEDNIRTQTFLLCIVTSGVLFFLYFPGARARYLHPIAPAIALLAGIVWEKVQSESALRVLATVFYIVLGILGITGIGTAYGLTAVLPHQALLLIGLGILCLISVIGMRVAWRKRFSFPAVLLQLALVWVLSQEGVMARESKFRFQLPVRQSALLMSSYVPDGETIYTLSMGDFNLFYYVKNPVRYIPFLADLHRDGREYYVAYRFLDDIQQFDRWQVLDFEVIPLSEKDCAWILKIR